MTAITADNFPTPHLALRSTDKDAIRQVEAFAVEQALAAEGVRAELTDALAAAVSSAERVNAFTGAHAELVRWRYALAQRATGRLGQGIAHNPSRFATPMRDSDMNYDRIGRIGRLRDGAEWDAGTRTFRGGHETPAYRIMRAYGDVAIARFAGADAGDTIHNTVILPDGSPVTGNSIVRGAAAERVAADLVARVARRGVDASQLEVGGEPMYVVTATGPNRDRMFAAAMELLAAAPPGDLAAWQAARYLLYQAPRTKKGSDAVTRVFLVVTGSVLLGRPPTLDHDIDLRCIVRGQDAATTAPADPTPT